MSVTVDEPYNGTNKTNKYPLDIEFNKLSYSVKAPTGWRTILGSISGKFRSGELTAIMGPTGAGKSTLLNILAGYITDVQGSVKINDMPQELKSLSQLSSYITQEDVIQPHITVTEALYFTTSLRLSHCSNSARREMIREIISLLGLDKCAKTRSEHLSGGEKKRLIIALELVSNPSIIFLDEPTTGLDEVTMKQCIKLLHRISRLNRTIICTIHQPPNTVFQSFDQVYILSEGCCVYNGAPSQLVQFSGQCGFICPQNYSPSDFIIELVNSQPLIGEKLKSASENGEKNLRIFERIQYRATAIKKLQIGSPFHVQFKVLLMRMLLQIIRNKQGVYLQLATHTFSGIIVGSLFYDKGNDGSELYTIAKMTVVCMVYLMYTFLMIPILLYPFEMQLLRREYLNRWYGLKAYFAALTLCSLPLTIVFICIFSSIVFFMSGLPFELDRLIGFYAISIMLGLTSQSLGLFTGILCNVKVGAIAGPCSLGVFLILSLYGVGYKGVILPFWGFLQDITYLRAVFLGYCSALFYQRPSLTCPEEELYCHYKDPVFLMEDLSVTLSPYTNHVAVLCIFLVLFRLLAFVALKCWLDNRKFVRLGTYFSKMIKYRY